MAALKDDNNLVREWETGLPSASDLTPLSHSLISRVLARAFCIPPSSVASPSSFDVLHASRVTLQLLQQKSSPSFPFPSFDPYSSYEAGHVGVMGLGEGMDEDRGLNGCLQRNRDDRCRRTMSFTNSAMTKTWDGQNGLERDGGGTEIGNGNCGSEFGQQYFWPAQGAMVSSIGQYGSLGNDQSAYVGLEAGSESVKGASLEKSRKVDTESEDVDSADGPDGNTARTLKRPRLVWTPQLHKRFVDAVGHLGIKNAVPKTIMQLMNVEGLTRENVASHLQKYRLYLKRMQGLSTEGPSASDPLFASTPLPPNLTPSQFFTSHPHSRMDNGVSVPPFAPPAVPMPRSQGTSAPGLIGPGSMATGSVQHFGGFDHPYNSALTRTAPQRPSQLGGHRGVDVLASQPISGSPPKRILTLFPPSGH